MNISTQVNQIEKMEGNCDKVFILNLEISATIATSLLSLPYNHRHNN